MAGGEGPEREVGCPVNAHDAFDMSLTVTKFVALICVLILALLLALQFSMRCLPFLQMCTYIQLLWFLQCRT